MRSLVIALTTLMFATAASSAPPANPGVQCATGTPCGNTCIAKGEVCHIKRQTGPTCRAGRTKACGLTCIPVKKTCHQ